MAHSLYRMFSPDLRRVGQTWANRSYSSSMGETMGNQEENFVHAACSL